LLGLLGNTAAVPVASDLTGAEKYVIMKGCQYYDNDPIIETSVSIKFNTIQNPFAKRDTDYFKIDIWKNWDSAGTYPSSLSTEIMDSHVSFISKDLYSVNIVENIEISAPNMMVQETTTHSFIFTTRSILPGT